MLDRAGEDVVEAGERLRPLDEGGDRLRLGGGHAGGDVDEHDGADELRVVVGEGERGDPPERHADHGDRVRRQGADDGRHVCGVVAQLERSLPAAVGVSVAR